MTTTVAEQSAVERRVWPPYVGRNRTARPAGETAGRVAPVQHVISTAPPLVMVFRTRDGRIGHARCGRPLAFQGRRAEIELDFYCPRCVEHVTLPVCILSRIPLGALAAGD